MSSVFNKVKGNAQVSPTNTNTLSLPSQNWTTTTPTGTGSLGQDYGQLLGKYQQIQQQYTGMFQPNVAPILSKYPSRECIKKRLDETQALLDLLKEVDRILDAHPDLERLIGTLGRLWEL